MTTTALVFHPQCIEHDSGPGHPESRERIDALVAAVDADRELADHVVRREGRPATESEVLRVHTAEHLARLREAARLARAGDRLVWIDEDTPVSGGSLGAALAGAGCAVSAAELVLDGVVGAAFALSRPPGHHASPDRAMGFCLLNNVAVAVRSVQASGRARRILVLDLDAHHGNGTQDVFYEDGSVFVVSLHAGSDFPGTGGAGERGAGPGLGATLNVPLPPQTSARAYRQHYLEALDSALSSFSPDLVFLSAGFDCLSGDPESDLMLEPADLHRLTSDLLERIPRAGKGRVVGVLEGGYALDRIGLGLVNMLRALTGLSSAP